MKFFWIFYYFVRLFNFIIFINKSRYGEELKCLYVNKNLNSFRKLMI